MLARSAVRLSQALRVRLSPSSVRSPVHIVSASYHGNIVDHYENPRNVGALCTRDTFVHLCSWLLTMTVATRLIG